MANTQNAAKEAKSESKSASSRNIHDYQRPKSIDYCQGRVKVSLGTLPSGVRWG